MSNTRDVDPMDVRIIPRSLRLGVLNQKELKRYIKDLPDVAGKAETLDEAQPLEPKTEGEESEG